MTLRPGYDAERSAPPRADRLRPQAPGRRGRAQGDRVRPASPEDAQRQDHAPAAPRARARPARRRPLDTGTGHVNTLDHVDRGRAAARHDPRAPVGGALRRALQLGADPRLRAPVRRRGGCCRRRDPRARRDDDAIVATYREHGHALVRGITARAIMAEMYGKTEGCSGGRGGSMHLFDVRAPLLRRERDRRAAACRSPSASRWPRSSGSSRTWSRASSVRVRSPRASSTSA